MSKLLELKEVELSFAGVKALKGISLDVNEGELLALIGPNGAGKTSLFNCISRVYVPQKGEIEFLGHSITKHPPHAMAGLGVARTFQNLALFYSKFILVDT